MLSPEEYNIEYPTEEFHKRSELSESFQTEKKAVATWALNASISND